MSKKSKATLADESNPETIEPVSEEQAETQSDLDPKAVRGEGDVVLGGSDWTVGTLIDQMRRGNIDLNPDFQRRDAWRRNRKSKFIESLILNLPVPQIVLAEKLQSRGSFVVIDGKQRLLSLRQFTAEEADGFIPLTLEELEIRPDLNGLTYKHLQDTPSRKEELAAFENQTMRTVVVRHWKTEDFLYTIFLRLNTGSLPLSPQELRQALHFGAFTKFLNEWTGRSKALMTLLELKEPDFRMRDVELALRYLAFRRYAETYQGNLKLLLDNTVVALNSEWSTEESSVKKDLKTLDAAIVAAEKCFGKGAFRKWNGNAFETRPNKAVFDAFVHYFANPSIASKAIKNHSKVVQGFKDLCDSNESFRRSIEGTTKSIKAFNVRLEYAAKLLARVTKLKVPAISVGSS